MEEEFELPVEYNNQQYLFKTSLIVSGYIHKFSVDVNGQTILFEPDEERNYRAILDYDDVNNNKNKNMDVELLKKISQTIKELFT